MRARISPQHRAQGHRCHPTRNAVSDLDSKACRYNSCSSGVVSDCTASLKRLANVASGRSRTIVRYRIRSAKYFLSGRISRSASRLSTSVQSKESSDKAPSVASQAAVHSVALVLTILPQIRQEVIEKREARRDETMDGARVSTRHKHEPRESAAESSRILGSH